MTDKNGMRAVIINNIKSGYIEQAIFILKSNAYDLCPEAGGGIVAEAQEIINSYIETIERNKKYKKCGGKNKIAVTLGVICLILAAVTTILLRF